jgi:tyrosine-specific transport protein
MSMKLLGGILLIAGTAIGAGMLALPVAAAELGFWGSSLLLIVCWFIMMTSAFLLLEVNLWLPWNNNVISMAKATLGTWGQLVAWIVYFLLLYALLAAYIAGGSDFLKNLLLTLHITIPNWLTSILFTIVLGYVVFLGVHTVDITNRFLMFAKLGSLLLVVGLVSPHVSHALLQGGHAINLLMSTTVMIASFGFATIIPSLRIYFHNDIKKLRLAILLGSLVPLVCYLAWDITIMGVIPREGENGLIVMSHTHQATAFVNELSLLLQNNIITTLTNVFTSVCLFTSFLGVALCLSDFLADGLQLEKKGKNRWIIHAITMIPPLAIVLFYPNAFITALSYAGIYTVILLILLPALMAWRGRYHKNLATGFRVPGGRVLLLCLIGISAWVIGGSVWALF